MRQYIEQLVSADIINYLLKTHKVTMADIVKYTGLSLSAISRIKNGQRSLTLFRLRRLEKELNIPLPILFLEAITSSSMPKDLKAHYRKLKKVLVNSRDDLANNNLQEKSSV